MARSRQSDTRRGLGLDWVVMVALASLLFASCGSGSPVTAPALEATSGPLPTPTSVFPPTPTPVPVEPIVLPDVVTVEMPSIPPIALPDLSVLQESGARVADQLGSLVTKPISGIELVTASCESDGGDLVYSGSTGNDLFDIEEDGGGTYRAERDGGLVTLDVRADGSGEFFDDTQGALVTIDVAADGSGEYYGLVDDVLTTVRTEAEGSGVFYRKTLDSLTTVTIHDDGRGELYSAGPTVRVTLAVAADGSGTFTREEGEFRPEEDDYLPVELERTITIRVDAVGGWVLTDETETEVVTLVVEPDGSGTYTQRGRIFGEVVFDRTGAGEERRVEVPPTPVLAVAARFPAIGTLGSLAPPCATVIRFDSQLLFDYNSADIRGDADDVLNQVVEALNDAGQAIEVNGHTDSRGGEQYNLDLSLERARAVERSLRDRGLTVEIVVNGYGESQPIAPNETETGEDNEAGRAQNRRVEIVLRG